MVHRLGADSAILEGYNPSQSKISMIPNGVTLVGRRKDGDDKGWKDGGGG